MPRCEGRICTARQPVCHCWTAVHSTNLDTDPQHCRDFVIASYHFSCRGKRHRNTTGTHLNILKAHMGHVAPRLAPNLDSR